MTKFMYYAEMFIKIVDTIFEIEKTGKQLTKTTMGSLLNIKPSNFKMIIDKKYPDADADQLLSEFKKLKFIVADGNGRNNTNVQKINKKPIRVVSIDKTYYITLKEYIGTEILG